MGAGVETWLCPAADEYGRDSAQSLVYGTSQPPVAASADVNSEGSDAPAPWTAEVALVLADAEHPSGSQLDLQAGRSLALCWAAKRRAGSMPLKAPISEKAWHSMHCKRGLMLLHG